MTIEHIKAKDLTTNKWSGGTTSQLVIYPDDADYKKRDFSFRLSTARVEASESTFTKLPDVSRHLMILEGEIKIEHTNHHSKTLKKFDVDKFSGDWDTKSYGKATDFNLMTTGDNQGEIEALTLTESITIAPDPNISLYAFYIYTGQTEFLFNNESCLINKGDLLILHSPNNNIILKNPYTQTNEIILSKIQITNN